MSTADIIVIICVLLLVAFAIYRIAKGRHGSCCDGCCDHCSRACGTKNNKQ